METKNEQVTKIMEKLGKYEYSKELDAKFPNSRWLSPYVYIKNIKIFKDGIIYEG